MDKQVLTSSRASEDVSRYSVGILREGMYVYHLHNVLFQLRKVEQVNWSKTIERRNKKTLISGICFHWKFFWNWTGISPKIIAVHQRLFVGVVLVYLLVINFGSRETINFTLSLLLSVQLCWWAPANCSVKLTNAEG